MMAWYSGGFPAAPLLEAVPSVDDSHRDVLGGCLPSGAGLGVKTNDGFPSDEGGGGIGAAGAGPE